MAEESPIRVLLVDDHGVVRRGIEAYLDLVDDIAMVGEAGNDTVTVASGAPNPNRLDDVQGNLLIDGQGGPNNSIVFDDSASPGPRRHAVNSVGVDGRGRVWIRTSIVRSAPMLRQIPASVSMRLAGRPSTRIRGPGPSPVAGGLLAFHVTRTPPGWSSPTGNPQEVVFPCVEHGSCTGCVLR